MARSEEDTRRRVYLACRAVFSGPKAQLRKQKFVRKEIQDHQAALRSLGDVGTDRVVEIVRSLLEREVFESDLKARLEFPSLFLSSPERDALREASELEATQSVLDAFENGITEGWSDYGGDTVEEVEEAARPLQPNGSTDQKNKQPKEKSAVARQSPSATIPSLHPVRLPYKAQHILLTEAQLLLEECFYDFARQWLPHVVEEECCDSPVAIELNHWTSIFRKHNQQIPPEALDPPDIELNLMLGSIRNLRHSAVHRLKLAGSDVQTLIKSGVALASMLKDYRRAVLLGSISNELDNKVRSMELMKNDAEKDAVARFQEIQRKREELAMEEKTLVADMLKKDAQNMNSIGILIEESVFNLLKAPPDHSAASEEGEDAVEGEGLEQQAGPSHSAAEARNLTDEHQADLLTLGIPSM